MMRGGGFAVFVVVVVVVVVVVILGVGRRLGWLEAQVLVAEGCIGDRGD
jgi:hypothetical protein